MFESSDARSYLVSKSHTSRHNYPRLDLSKDPDISRKNNQSTGRQQYRLNKETFITGIGNDS